MIALLYATDSLLVEEVVESLKLELFLRCEVWHDLHPHSIRVCYSVTDALFSIADEIDSFAISLVVVRESPLLFMIEFNL